MSSPSEVLLAAADRVRDLAAAASPGAWSATDLTEHGHPGVWWVECVHRDNDGTLNTTVADLDRGHAGDARWIAALSPAIAPAIEGWLREMAAVSARVADMEGLSAADGSLMRHALDLAEAILGSGVVSP